ncbi:phosphotransferase enzyme family protein [Alkalihalobacillus trypoxylicola]|uniref:Aminoglycoside phosphotransferase domain-containing protein n=1 Tax=Alkalihalobacillus trypoxylicola TaxID=519424 RepID=A0A161PCN5_9BACI|nr:phosphotransferase [Alkalihalobacillus trypoxylicola]KYG30492.1 hypothetical protein AZF04_19605 [Alkalihalobacillus trypoxylicola]
MLKLKYLFYNEDLANMLLANWNFQTKSLDLFKYYRISSNAIYPFEAEGSVHFLRFAPISEKRETHLFAEFEFISYLLSKEYGALQVVPSSQNETLLKIKTPWGEYYASVFKRVAGMQLNKTDLNDDIIFSYGKALGRLHQLSSEYSSPQYKRWSHHDVLNWISDTLSDFPNEILAKKEAHLLQDYFNTLPISKKTYGLIHYDFEYDNVFYDEVTKSCQVIDFDDMMYHWYGMDIEKALNCLKDCISLEKIEQKTQCFLSGYSTEFEFSEQTLVAAPAFQRFANLYSYVRILRSLEEMWKHEPQWLEHLRINLRNEMNDLSTNFGIEI